MAESNSLRVVWSAIHTGAFDEAYFHRVIDRAAAEGVHGVELSGRNLSTASAYCDYPALAAGVDQAAAAAHLATLQRLSGHAAERGLRFGLWHHEINAPNDWLARMPELRAADGLIDLDNPLLYEFITTKIRVFLDACPHVSEIVLTMTETLYPVFRRPFCPIPIAERVRRVLAAVLAATEPLGRHLVIRPFSAIRDDELHVREAVESLSAQHLSLMYKTEPFDWHPWLPNEPLIGSVPRYEARAETDAGAEYYGMGAFPCSYVRHLEHRLQGASAKGAGGATIRVDRGFRYTALDHPINEGNVIASTRWALNPSRSFKACWGEWFKERHGAEPDGWFETFESTFDVIRNALYINGQAYTHHQFPTLRAAKHVQAFGQFEEDVPLAHMARNWGVLADSRTTTHEALLAEKQAGVELARKILVDFDARAQSLPATAREAIRMYLARLPLLAETCMQFCRLTIAHLQDVWHRAQRSTASFAEEAAAMRAIADRIDHELGPNFWDDLAAAVRDMADGLEEERRMELPLRKTIESRPGLVDYVLCGFASEGHRLEKMLHSGSCPTLGGRLVRSTGIGPEAGFGYTLCRKPNQAHRLAVTLAGEKGADAPGRIRIGDQEHELNVGPLDGLREITFEVPPSADELLSVHIWSTTKAPCRVAALVLSA